VKRPGRSRVWAGLIAFLLILSGAIWFTLDQHATTVRDDEVRTIPYAIRKEAKVGPDYLVAVTTVNLNANAAIERANSSNDPPKGQYVIATLAAKYVGDKEGHPRTDLVVTYAGSDSRTYDKSTCLADLGGASKPTVTVDGTATYSVCFDLPEPAISGGNVGVAERNSSNKVSYWEINN